MSKANALHKTLVIIPALNEEEGIGLVLEELLKTGVPKENILVIDGGSTDRTVEIARSMGVKVVRQRGKGKAEAVREGLEEAFKRGFEYAVIIDADYTYPASAIPRLLSRIEQEGLDEVIGARVDGRENIPLLNRFGNWVLNKVFNLLFGTNLRDVCSGLYAVRLSSLLATNPTPVETRGFSVEADIAAKIASTTGRIGEENIVYRKRRGKAKLRVSDGLRIATSMIRLAWRYNPVFILFLLASLLLVPGLLLGGYVAFSFLLYGIKYHVKGLLAAVLTTTGLIGLLFSIQSLYLKRLEYRMFHRLRLLEEELKRRRER